MTTGISSLDRSLQKTLEWIGDLGIEDRNRAWSCLRAVLHALRDLYCEGWDPLSTPRTVRIVSDPLVHMPDVDVESLTRSVFGLLERKITGGEIADVRGILPKPLQLWPAEEVGPVLTPRGKVRADAAERRARGKR